MKKLLITLIFSSFALSAHANPRLIGILGGEQNQNLHVSDPVLEAFKASDVKLYNKPKDKKPLTTAKGREIYAETYNLNRTGPMVYGFKKFSWYMVGHGERAYWIDVLPNIRFYTYYDLVRARSSYLNEWDGQIYADPAEGPTKFDVNQLMKGHRAHPPVEVHGKEMVDGELWLRISIMDSSCYELDRPSKVVITGWVPAYASSNETTVWFNSKQCK